MRAKVLRLSVDILTWSHEWLFEAYRHCSDRQHFSKICPSIDQINGLKHIAESVVNTVRHCRSFGFWRKLANNCEMFDTLLLSDKQTKHRWIAQSPSLRTVYDTWLHIVERFVLKTWHYDCRSSGLSYPSVAARWASTAAFRTEMVKTVLVMPVIELNWDDSLSLANIRSLVRTGNSSSRLRGDALTPEWHPHCEPKWRGWIWNRCESIGFPSQFSTVHGSLLKLSQFNSSQFASVYSAVNEYEHCWECTCDGLASCPGESVQLQYKVLALNDDRNHIL